MRIGVVMGGVSSEREVSLNTGREIMNNLDKTKYTIEPIIIDSKKDLIEKTKGIDMALLALHGTFGEDGTVQGVLETLDIPYTGCGVLSSALCMDKDMTKKILKLDGINTGKWIIARSTDDIDFTELKDIGYPVVVKPNSGGSSVATRIVDSPEGVRGAVEEALKYDREVMIEEYIRGDEITCPILKGKMLPILAIKPKSSFFDYTSKYEDGGAEEFVIEFEGEMQRKIEDMAVRCYELLKCSVYARVDMIIKDGVPYVLEINTLPGMTKNSLMPKSARAVGISFTQLLDLIIEHSRSEREYK